MPADPDLTAAVRGPAMLRARRPFSVLTSVVGARAIAAILAGAWRVPGMRSTVLAGRPWLLALAAGYWYSARPAPPPRPASSHQGVDA